MMRNKDGRLAGQVDCTEDVGLYERERERERERGGGRVNKVCKNISTCTPLILRIRTINEDARITALNDNPQQTKN